jgi:hypothetical protein
MSFYVDITHKSKADLETIGLYVVAENPEFYVLRGKDYSEHIIQKNSPKQYIYVEDINDAICLDSKSIVSVKRQ